MADEHSNFAPSSFYRVTYRKEKSKEESNEGSKKKSEKPRSVSYLSQWMSYWIDMRKAIRGRIRGEYYIRGDIREEFERIAASIKAKKDIIKVSDEEAADLNQILGKQETSIPATIAAVPKSVVREQSKSNEENRVAWQEVLKGFQLYRDIFQTGMDNPKTQDGLYGALSQVCARLGLTEKEAIKKMDTALAIASDHTGTKE
jgi:hypothetical protein